MKKLWFGIALAVPLTIAVSQAVLAAPPGVLGDPKKDCIGYCQSKGWIAPRTGDEFAIMHTNGTGCPMMNGATISDAPPPQP